MSRQPSSSSRADASAATHADEVRRGERFEFGKNWKHFLAHLDEDRIVQAEQSLVAMLGVPSLLGRTFLDVGSGSGLFSLAARRLGARVHSFDYDPQSVQCTRELRRRFFSEDDELWKVEQASVLDDAYMQSLGAFDIVYCWGMLHQTGAMWHAMDNAARAVSTGGTLFISIYNDQGGASRRWLRVKQLYNRSPQPVKLLLVLGVGAYGETRAALIRLVRLQNPLPFRDWALKKKTRGMSVWHDLVDWVGGYPFEVAKPEQVFDFCRSRGFTLQKLITLGSGHGCNEFVFQRIV
jgi:2-polyprenyl-3-methyl-5-hydroxy-6-metoxy-1,4-benzoquinol methylase